MKTRIRQVIEDLVDRGVVANSENNCMGMSKIVQIMLAKMGISSHLIECELTIINRQPPNIIQIGHDRSVSPGQLATHVVVITDTDPPYLIDASIAHLTMPYRMYVLEQLSTNDEYVLEGNTWIYHEKDTNLFPSVLQGHMLTRMVYDLEIKTSIQWLQRGMILILLAILLDLVVRLI
jgi:hypothetical protein